MECLLLFIFLHQAIGIKLHSTDASKLQSPLLQFLEFINILESEYFDSCTLIILTFSEGENETFKKAENQKPVVGLNFVRNSEKNQTLSFNNENQIFLQAISRQWISRIVYEVNDKTMSELNNHNLNTVSKCPIYISISPGVRQLNKLFHSRYLDWDKYLLSRKHLAYVEGTLDQVEKFLNNDAIKEFLHFILFWHESNTDQFKVLSNKPFDTDAKGAVTFIGTWKNLKSQILQKKGPKFFEDKLTDFKGFAMKVVTFDFRPSVFMTKSSTSEDNINGRDGMVVLTIAKALNIKVEFQTPSDGGLWGWELPNGTWTGLIGDLQSRKAHLAVADLYIMEPYFKVCDMSVEFDFDYMCFLNLVPRPLPQWLALALPFAPTAWYTIILTIVLGTFFYIALAKLSNKTPISEPNWFYSSANILMLNLSCVVNISSIKAPRSTPLRIFFIIWSFAFLIIAIVYRSSLFSYLTVPLQQAPIDTHKALYEKGTSVGSIGPTFQKLLESNADPIIRKLATRYTVVSSPAEGLSKTLEGKFSLMESKAFLEFVIAENYTSQFGQKYLHIMKEYIAPFGVGIAFPKYVSYIKKFNDKIREITEAGLTIKWQNDIILEVGRSSNREALKTGIKDQHATSSTAGALTTDNLQGGFIILLIGIATATLLFIVEIIVGIFMNRKIKNNPIIE